MSVKKKKSQQQHDYVNTEKSVEFALTAKSCNSKLKQTGTDQKIGGLLTKIINHKTGEFISKGPSLVIRKIKKRMDSNHFILLNLFSVMSQILLYLKFPF